MAVPPDISREHLREELELAQMLAPSYGWKIEPDLELLFVRTTLTAHNGDAFLLTARFDDYKATPPLLEFVDPDTGTLGTPHAYPRGTDSFFHGFPCICAPFSRKAYAAFTPGAPHGDWRATEWMTSTANGIQWINYSTFPAMLGLIQTRISRPDFYRGRMA